MLDEDEWRERVNWCHLGEGASLVSKWKLAKVEEEEQGEEVEEEEDGQEEQEEEEGEGEEEEGEGEEEEGEGEEEEEDEEWELPWLKEQQEHGEKEHCLSLHLQRDSLQMKFWGDCGTSSFPGISMGTARYGRLPARGTAKRETAGAATVELQPLKDGQVQTLPV